MGDGEGDARERTRLPGACGTAAGLAPHGPRPREPGAWPGHRADPTAAQRDRRTHPGLAPRHRRRGRAHVGRGPRTTAWPVIRLEWIDDPTDATITAVATLVNDFWREVIPGEPDRPAAELAAALRHTPG